MPRLLIVHHTPSPGTQELLDAVESGARNDAIEGVEVITRSALAASDVDVLGVDGYIIGTPANLGYMSGAMKHLFDRIYYPCLGETGGRPYALYVHGNDDTTGAVRAVESIVGGLEWQRVREPLELIGDVGQEDVDACWELGATVAAGLAENLA